MEIKQKLDGGMEQRAPSGKTKQYANAIIWHSWKGEWGEANGLGNKLSRPARKNLIG